METVSVSKLKGNLALYLSKLKAGHSFVVTDRGIAVAVFEPLAWNPDEIEAMKQLVKTGQVTPPSHELTDEFFTKPKVKDPQSLLRRFLREDREFEVEL